MSPLPADPVGRALAQMIARDQYERWLAGEVTSLLERGFGDIVKTLTVDYRTLGPAEQARRARLLQQIKAQLTSTYGGANKFLQAQMKEYAAIEVKATLTPIRALVAKSKTIDVTLEGLTKAEVRAIAEFPIAGLNIGEWFEKQATDMHVAVRGQIQLGLLNGEGPNEIARRIMPVREADTPAAAYRQARHKARTLVRTSTTTVQTQASYETLKNIDPKLVPGYRYVAVRDARTTPICRALDGKVFRWDDPKAKRPPQHVNCRSTIVGEVDYKRLGIPAPNTLPGGFTMGSYTDWLKSQPTSLQDDILGKTGAGLFRGGKATLAELVDTDGRRMTIAALKELYAA